MISSTFMGPYQQPGVAGCATSLQQYPVAGSYPLFRARATHHIHFSPEHQTEESSPEEERRRTISRHLWIQVQATVCPDILINFMPALWPSIHTNLPCTLYTTTNPEPIQNQMWNLPIVPIVKVMSCTRGNFRIGWKPLRSLDQRMDLNLGAQFMQF